MMRGTIAGLLAFVLFGGMAASVSGRQAGASKPDPWFARSTKIAFQPEKAPDAPVTIEVPKKDWMLLPSNGSVLLIAATRKGDAAVFVERSELSQPLEPTDITDLFAQIESDGIKEREPRATEFQAKVLDVGDRRLVAVQYTRPGVLGTERVRQYSLPLGKQLYRVTCASSAAKFAAYDPVFAHMAASFSVGQ
jgi:hypothetical protein